ncbi:MAG: TRAP transporter permease [Thermoanaerobacteraceae bacterium]|nr:TRAP transporter permease [Thermoanaerobacteraceae bacterium]
MDHKENEVVDIQEFMSKVDKESDFRKLKGFAGRFVWALAIAFSVFQVYTAAFGVLDAMIQRSIHLGFGLALIFLLYPTRKSWSRDRLHWFDVFLAILGAAAPAYIIIFYKDLVLRAGTVTTLDMIVGAIGILLVLEAARRIVGWPMVIVALVFLAYAFLGPYVPGDLAHRGVTVSKLVGHMFYTTEGIFGIPLMVSSTFIFLFILFGAFLEKTGMGQLFIDLANAVAGWAVGGPAKVAVLSSALMGTISGSSVANVVGTGSFTIPMMKKLGYKPEFAGAVEAAASTGGQLMPPIMGAAAFLMAEFIGVPYLRVVTAAIIPAVLYYMGVWISVDLEARKLGLKGMKREDIPKFKDVIIERGHLLIPLIAIIWLLVSGYTPMRVALIAIILSVVCSFLRKNTRISFKDIVNALEQGARSALSIVAATACAGIIVGVVTLTGLGLKFATTMVEFANGNLLLTLIFVMFASLILGMGVPTTANYVITSTIAAPALILMKIPTLAAHMFAFYFGIVADITPPVALAAYAGSGIAKGNPMQTGINATKIAIAAFLVPYIFVYNPQMLLIDAKPFEIIWMIITASIGMYGVGASMIGYMVTDASMIERVLMFVGGVLLVTPGIETDLIGFIILAVIFIYQRRKKSLKVKMA